VLSGERADDPLYLPAIARVRACLHQPGLLSLALRVLTRLQFVVRRRLAQDGAALAGLYTGNPKRATTHPTTGRLLEALQEITLTLVIEPHQTGRHVTALSYDL
jgi:hypothetical protein